MWCFPVTAATDQVRTIRESNNPLAGEAGEGGGPHKVHTVSDTAFGVEDAFRLYRVHPRHLGSQPQIFAGVFSHRHAPALGAAETQGRALDCARWG